MFPQYASADRQTSEMKNKSNMAGPALNLYIHSSAFTQRASEGCGLGFAEILLFGSSTMRKATAVHLMPPAPLLTPSPFMRVPR